MPEAGRSDLASIREQFISQWGALGSAWGVNRAMAQIHALLLISPHPLSTDEVMEALDMSRGGANTNLRELVSWGLVEKVHIKGERKDFFVAEKVLWRIFCIVARERKRREVDPAVRVLRQCAEQSKRVRGAEARAFHQQMVGLQEFVSLASSVMDRVASSEESKIVPAVLKILK